MVPGRCAVYHKLGQISAAAGFLADARQNFLENAQRMKRAGNLDASFDALKEFADLSPEDTEVRKLLADQLLSHGRKDQASHAMLDAEIKEQQVLGTLLPSIFMAVAAFLLNVVVSRGRPNSWPIWNVSLPRPPSIRVTELVSSVAMVSLPERPNRLSSPSMPRPLAPLS